MQEKWSICAILYFACVIPMNLFCMFDKETKDEKTNKQTNKQQKKNPVTRNVTDYCMPYAYALYIHHSTIFKIIYYYTITS